METTLVQIKHLHIGDKVRFLVREQFEYGVGWYDSTPSGANEYMGNGIVVDAGDDYVRFENGYSVHNTDEAHWSFAVE